MLQHNKEKLRKRARAEWRFRSYGILSLLFAASALFFLVSTIVTSGHTAFFRTTIALEFELDPERLGIERPYTSESLWDGSYYTAAKRALYALFPEVTARPDKRALSRILSPGAELDLRAFVVTHPEKLGETVTLEVPVSSDYDQLYKGHLPRTGKHTRLNALEMERFDRLVDEGAFAFFGVVLLRSQDFGSFFRANNRKSWRKGRSLGVRRRSSCPSPTS